MLSKCSIRESLVVLSMATSRVLWRCGWLRWALLGLASTETCDLWRGGSLKRGRTKKRLEPRKPRL